LEGFGAEFGGLDRMTPSGQQVVRRLAQVSVELELMESARAAGDAIDPVTFCTLVNSQRRLLRDAERLGARSGPPKPTLEAEIEAARRVREAAAA
jgi:hypothetical protein